MTKKGWIWMGAIAAIALLLGYYLGTHHQKTPTATPSPAASTSPTASASPKASPTSSAQAAARCTAAELRLTLSAPSGAAGHQIVNLGFVNSGSRTCELHGFPGVSMVDAAGAQLGQPAAEVAGATVATVTIAPGQTAYAPLDFPNPANFTIGTCSANGTNLKAFAPGETTPLLVAATYESCPGWQVKPVQATPIQ